MPGHARAVLYSADEEVVANLKSSNLALNVMRHCWNDNENKNENRRHGNCRPKDISVNLVVNCSHAPGRCRKDDFLDVVDFTCSAKVLR